MTNLGLATAPDGSVVQLRPLRRGIGRLLVDALRLLRSLDADLIYRHGLVEGRQRLCAGRAVRG